MGILKWRIQREKKPPEPSAIKAINEAAEKIEDATQQLKVFADQLRREQGELNEQQ